MFQIEVSIFYSKWLELPQMASVIDYRGRKVKKFDFGQLAYNLLQVAFILKD